MKADRRGFLAALLALPALKRIPVPPTEAAYDLLIKLGKACGRLAVPLTGHPVERVDGWRYPVMNVSDAIIRDSKVNLRQLVRSGFGEPQGKL